MSFLSAEVSGKAERKECDQWLVVYFNSTFPTQSILHFSSFFSIGNLVI